MRHREGNVQWIYSILLDGRISSSFGTEEEEECREDPTDVHHVL